MIIGHHRHIYTWPTYYVTGTKKVLTTNSMWKVLGVCFVMVTYAGCTSIAMPRELGTCFIQPGDMYIGFLVSIHAKGKGQFCSEDLSEIYMPQKIESFVYAIDEINSRNDILPNITLGYVILDTCNRDLSALGQVMHFVPLTETLGGFSMSCTSQFSYMNVAGVVGFINSRQAVMVSSLLSLFQVPIVGSTASSDDLSDKLRFEYFQRVVPPDKYQTQAILDFVLHFNWTYASLLYSAGSYGENGARHLQSGAKERGICFAVSKKILADATKKDYVDLVELLLLNTNAKVVIIFIYPADATLLFHTLEDYGISGKFIFIGGDALGDKDFGPASVGAFTVTFALGESPLFNEHFLGLTPESSANHTWMYELWEILYNCTWNSDRNRQSCQPFADMPKQDQPLTKLVSKAIDSVYTLAYGIDILVKEECPQAKHNKSLLQTCVKGEALLPYLHNVSFIGRSGPIKFDAVGDMIGQYSFKQYVIDTNNKGYHIDVAIWDQGTREVRVVDTNVHWEALIEDSVVKTVHLSQRTVIPMSICSLPCHIRQYAIRLELPCCWECRSCRNNERMNDNMTGCELCLPNTWPDSESGTYCEDILPTYLQWTDPVVVGLVGLTCLCLIISITTIMLFIKHHNTKLIKASSRELSSVILCGIVLAYFVVITFILKPQDWTCVISRVGFNISVSMIYAPLLIKTNRVHRIFSSGKKSAQTVHFIGSKSQLIGAAILLLLQVCHSILLFIP